MKKLTLFIFMLTAFMLAAAELPKQWDYWFWSPDDKLFQKVNSPAQLKSQSNILSGKFEIPAAGVDFNKSAKGWEAAMVRGYIHAEKPQTMWLGVGCRIFSLALNGKVIYDLRNKGLGNDYDPVTAEDHIIMLPLKAGKNEIVITTKRTNFLMDYCYGANRKINWNLVLKEHKNYHPVKAELAHPEVVLRPGNGSFLFSFMTKVPVPAGIDYRVKGTKQWTRAWDLAGEIIFREKSRIHRIRINNIPAGKDLEYRIVLLEPPAGLQGMRRAMWTKIQFKEILLPVKTLRNPDRKEFAFFVFGDTQLSISTTCRTVADRKKFMQRMRSLPEYKNSDFVVLIGDLDSYMHDMEKTYLTDFFDDFKTGSNEIVKPWVFVRGNHELDGLAAEEWFDFFQMPEDKSYYAFKLGDVLLIALDCGDFFHHINYTAHCGPLLDLNNLFKRQQDWLKKLQKTEMFRTAKYRIILSHSEPQISKRVIENGIRNMTLPLLKDDSDESRIHLWIAGHVHRYWRARKGSKTVVSRTPIKKPALKVSPVNWVSLDGPKGDSSDPNFSYLWVKVSENRIYAKAIDENGNKLDEFVIDLKGTFKELFRAKELKDLPFQ
ncbi:MAG: metallophosphoesterase [Lentisphaeria bacterium]|nr:metallophosphoesterase [Lentisphaeria bacterium]